MKKIITSLFILILGVFMTNQVAYAADKFNTDPSDLPTVMVTNITQSGGCGSGSGAGCWQTSVDANPGDTIGVQVYFHNSTTILAQNTQVGMGPRSSGVSSNHTFTGAVASTTIDRASGSATVRTNSAQSITFIPGTVRAYIRGQTVGYTVANESALFGSGVPIGDVSPGWDTQGTITAQFKVGDTVIQPINNCRIDNFYASPQFIDSGNSSTLSWNTSGCTSVNISSLGATNQGLSGITTVTPNYTTTYTLTAYGSNGVAPTQSVTVTVNGNQQNNCSVTFSADQYVVNQGSGTTLRWYGSGINSVQIYPNVGNQNNMTGSAYVVINSPTTYTLTAYGCGTTYTRTVTINTNNVIQTSTPQAITTVATVLGGTQARLNGIAVPNTTNMNTTAWFEWGISGSFGNRTNVQTATSGNSSQYYSDIVSGLVPGATYFYRAVVQNQNGIAYGDIVRFQTTRTTIVTPPTPIIVRSTPIVRNMVVAQSASSLLELRVESNYDRMCVNGQIDYTVSYRNISSKVLEKAVLRFTHPKEITYLSTSRGEYDVVDRTLTIDLSNIKAGEQGTITIRARVNDGAIRGNLTVATATVVYTNSTTKAQENAIAYSLITVSDDCPNVLGASVFGFGAFLPSTLIGWLLLILVILALIVLGRHLYKKNEQPS